MSKHSETVKDFAGGYRMAFFVTELDDTADMDLQRFLVQQNPPDETLARIAMLRSAIEGLKIWEPGAQQPKTYSYDLNKKKPPRVKDSETGKTISDLLTGYVIKYNPWIVDDEEYSWAFQDYAFEDQETPVSNPTPFRPAVSE